MIAFGDRQLFATVVFNRPFSYAGSFRDWGFGCRTAAMGRIAAIRMEEDEGLRYQGFPFNTSVGRSEKFHLPRRRRAAQLPSSSFGKANADSRVRFLFVLARSRQILS